MTLLNPKDWLPQGVDELEDAAWTAIELVAESVAVTAGAGAGKTEFLAQKAAYLLQTGLCPVPKRILAISFKRDAAETLRQRVLKRCGADRARRFVSVTFDAFSKGLVDQFRLAIPEQYRPPAEYRIDFPNRDSWEAFFRRRNINRFNPMQFERLLLGRRLHDETQNISADDVAALDTYWQDQYSQAGGAFVTFPMINRLAEYLLRTNRRVRSAIRMSYPFVFLDEFQDAQASQFELLAQTFEGSDSKFTAVGDDKQRIMGWAGAMPDAFNVFTTEFDAKSVSLLLNWRSHADLVAVQHRVARQIDPNVEEVIAKAEKTVDGATCAIWDFPTPESEFEGMAKWIAAEVEQKRVAAHDIAVLVRSGANEVEASLAPALAERGVSLRNIARNVGDIAIQDLLAEEFTDILMPFLRLGATRRAPAAWSDALDAVRWIDSVIDSDEIGLQRVVARTERIAKLVRTWMKNNAVELASAHEIVEILVEEIGEANIRRISPSYNRAQDYRRVRDGFEVLLANSMSTSASWPEALDLFEGRGQVPLMTVHKSKGMEFHTMIFFGLDSQTWWSLTPTRPEELNSFFVALTRAKQRAFFTSCAQRGNHIGWLDKLLGGAVAHVDGTAVWPAISLKTTRLAPTKTEGLDSPAEDDGQSNGRQAQRPYAQR